MKDALAVIGWLLASIGLAVVLGAMIIPSAPPGARVVSYEMLNAKVLVAVIGSAFLVAGVVMASAAALIAALERQTAALAAGRG